MPNPKPNHYLAITLGPIFKTMALAKKTRELWAASYIFSHIMGQLVEKLKDKGEILFPFYDNSNDIEKISAGLFPDRLIMEIAENKIGSIKAILNNHQNTVIDGLDNAFAKDYFLVHYLFIELPPKQNPIKTISPILDSLEQQATYISNSKKDEYYIKNFLKEINKQDLFISVFGKNYRFPSVPKIASWGLRNINEKEFDELFKDDEDDNYKNKKDIYSKLRDEFQKNKNETILFQYHKYMAIVHADGDNMGDLIEALYETGGIQAIQTLSALLMDFGKKATNTIKEYGGVPIYLGGDDMLFFAPVKNDEKDIFKLVTQLDNLFAEKLGNCDLILDAIHLWNLSCKENTKRKTVSLPTLSFGVAISYHKYPLQEALETGRSLLFDTAKKIPGKNAIAFRYLKHSGQYIGTALNKDMISWKMLQEFIDKEYGVKEIINSIQYKLEPLRPLLVRMLTGRLETNSAGLYQSFGAMLPDEENREFLIKNFTDNFYNEGEVHRKAREFIEDVATILLQTHRDLEDVYGNNADTANRAIDTLYATLRIKQFFLQKSKEEN